MDKMLAIGELIEKNYKTTQIYSVSVLNDYVTLRVSTNKCNYPYIALRILNKYPEIRVVHFTGGFIEYVYTRETLKWGGYKIK